MVIFSFDSTNMARRFAGRQTYLGSGFELSVNGGIWGMKRMIISNLSGE